MTHSQTLKRALSRFKRNQTGNVAVEFLLMFPILLWTLTFTMQTFDAYRIQLVSTKAALTIADMFSRAGGDVDPVSDDYLAGTKDLLAYLTNADESPNFRATVFYWDEDDAKYYIVWSKSSLGNDAVALSKNISWGDEALDNPGLTAIKNRLPIMSDQERGILIETWTDYTPNYGRGMGVLKNSTLTPFTFEPFVVISPRFAPSVCFSNTPDVVESALC